MAQLSKVLKVVCWAGSVPFPPVSLQRQVVCLLLRPVFMCFHQGRAYTVSWLVGVQIKVMLQQPLTCGSSSMLPLNSPPHSPTWLLYLLDNCCCLVFTFCFHVLNVLFACVFSNTDTVFWLVQIKVMLQQPLTCDSSSVLPTCFPHSLPRSPKLIYSLQCAHKHMSAERLHGHPHRVILKDSHPAQMTLD